MSRATLSACHWQWMRQTEHTSAAHLPAYVVWYFSTVCRMFGISKGLCGASCRYPHASNLTFCVWACLQVDNREVLNCYYAHADQADQLQASPVCTRPRSPSLSPTACKLRDL